MEGIVCDYPIMAMERAMDAMHIPATRAIRGRRSAIIGKALAKYGVMRNLWQGGHKAYVVPMLHCAAWRFFPLGFIRECIPFAMDIWPPKYPIWETFFRRYNIRTAFLTARQSAEHFQKMFPDKKILWLAEAVDPTQYRHDIPLADRRTQVLELGRRWAEYHDKIQKPLEERGRSHLYAKYEGHLIFPKPQDLVNGMADSIVSVCFPQSLTHPKNAGNVETVTLRYFETMASKCVPVGRSPQELIDLFGYNPMIEIDLNHAPDQLEEIVSNPAKYQPMVDRNFDRLMQVGTWDARMRELFEKLKTLGYEVQ